MSLCSKTGIRPAALSKGRRLKSKFLAIARPVVAMETAIASRRFASREPANGTSRRQTAGHPAEAALIPKPRDKPLTGWTGCGGMGLALIPNPGRANSHPVHPVILSRLALIPKRGGKLTRDYRMPRMGFVSKTGGADPSLPSLPSVNRFGLIPKLGAGASDQPQRTQRSPSGFALGRNHRRK